MNFISNVLDSIPVVGHVKGVIHYAAGDTGGGHKAMYQSTRTSAVLAGGAVGCLAGPAGAALGGVYGGMITDGIVSVAKDEPVGLFESTTNIGKDIASGKAPLASIGSATFQIAMDGIGGFGMGGVTSAVGDKVVTKTVESTVKKAASTVGEEMIEKSVKLTAEEMAKLVSKKTTEKVADKILMQAAKEAQVVLVSAHVGVTASKRTEEERKREEQEKQHKEKEKQRKEKEKREEQERQRKEKEKREEQERQRKEKEKREEKHASPGGSQPPQGNKDNNKKSEEAEEELDDLAVIKKFKEILRNLLRTIYGNNTEPFTRIFDGLSGGQRQYLIDTIRHIMPYGTLEAVMEVVIKMFKVRFPRHISFTNILSLLEFVQAYIWAEVKKRMAKPTATRPALKYRERRTNAIRDVVSQDIVTVTADLFQKLQDDIRDETAPPNNIFPDFRDLFSAAYHYFKHKSVPGDGVLTIKQYYDYIRLLLKELKKSPEYDAVKQYLEKLKKQVQKRNDREDNATIICEMYIVIFGRMFRIVVKIGYGTVVLSSAYVVKTKCVGVKEGTVVIKIIRKDDDK